MASGWHGQGAVHGRSGAGTAWGIGHRGRRGAGGEVTARGGVGVVLPKLGVHGGHGGVLGRRRGSRVCRCGVRSRRVVGRDGASPLWVSEGGSVEENRGRGFW
jgi:hypothetical protein